MSTRKIYYTLILSMWAFCAYAQLFSKDRVQNLQTFDKKRFSYGYIIGLNHYQYNLDYNDLVTDLPDIEQENSFGFSVGLLGNLRLNDYFDLRLEPQISFAQRKIIFPKEYLGRAQDVDREIPSTYIHVPLLLKMSSKRINNFKVFLLGGVGAAYNLSSNERNPDDNTSV